MNYLSLVDEYGLEGVIVNVYGSLKVFVLNGLVLLMIWVLPSVKHQMDIPRSALLVVLVVLSEKLIVVHV